MQLHLLEWQAHSSTAQVNGVLHESTSVPTACMNGAKHMSAFACHLRGPVLNRPSPGAVTPSLFHLLPAVVPTLGMTFNQLLIHLMIA